MEYICCWPTTGILFQNRGFTVYRNVINNNINNLHCSLGDIVTDVVDGSLAAHVEKSRRFSKLPPAPKNSPNAVKLGSKFTKIEIPEKIETKQALEEELQEEIHEEVSEIAKINPNKKYISQQGDQIVS